MVLVVLGPPNGILFSSSKVLSGGLNGGPSADCLGGGPLCMQRGRRCCGSAGKKGFCCFVSIPVVFCLDRNTFKQEKILTELFVIRCGSWNGTVRRQTWWSSVFTNIPTGSAISDTSLSGDKYWGVFSCKTTRLLPWGHTGFFSSLIIARYRMCISSLGKPTEVTLK